jgi:RNA polymerase sigma-70 factor (ECF subfamily)
MHDDPDHIVPAAGVLPDGAGRALSAERAWADGFDELIRRLRPSLLRFFRRRTPSAAVAEELVQDLFVRLLRRSDLFQLENIDGYVFEAASNLARDRARRDAARGAGRHVRLDGLEMQSGEPTAEQIVDDRRRVERLYEALEALPHRTRAVLILNRFEGMTYQQIASALGISVSAVEKHMVKALSALQSYR